MISTYELQEQAKMARIREHYTRVQRGVDICSPRFLQAIRRNYFMIREPSATWWQLVEMDQDQATTAKVGDVFLCRRDNHETVDYPITNPTPEEIATLKRSSFHKDKYVRSVPYIREYVSVREENNCWTRYCIAYLPDEPSPFPNSIDCQRNW